MGRTSQSKHNSTKQVDSRQMYQNAFNTKSEYRVEDSNNQRFEFEDRSEGNVRGGRDVFVQSDHATKAATQFFTKASEEDSKKEVERAREIRKQQEAAEKTRQIQAEEDRKKEIARAEESRKRFEAQMEAIKKQAEEDAKKEAKRAEEYRLQAVEAQRTAQEANEQMRQVANQSHNTVVSLNASNQATFQRFAEENRRTTEAVTKESTKAVTTALESNEASFATLTNQLEKDSEEDTKVFKESLGLISDKLSESDKTNREALQASFSNTVGGLAEQQQQGMLITVGMMVLVVGFVTWRSSK